MGIVNGTLANFSDTISCTTIQPKCRVVMGCNKPLVLGFIKFIESISAIPLPQITITTLNTTLSIYRNVVCQNPFTVLANVP